MAGFAGSCSDFRCVCRAIVNLYGGRGAHLGTALRYPLLCQLPWVCDGEFRPIQKARTSHVWSFNRCHMSNNLPVWARGLFSWSPTPYFPILKVTQLSPSFPPPSHKSQGQLDSEHIPWTVVHPHGRGLTSKTCRRPPHSAL